MVGREARARLVRLLAVLGLVALFAAGCGDDDDGGSTSPEASEPGGSNGSSTTEAAGEPVSGGELTWSQQTEIASMDPVVVNASAGQSGTRLAAVYGGLVAFGQQTLEAEPWMAESFEPNADFTQWTLKLRSDLEFSDGTAFDATAVKTNWERPKDPANRSPAIAVASSMTALDVVDATTLKVTLKAPNAHLPAEVSRNGLNYIASPAAIASGTLASKPVGAGPFVMTNWIRDDRMELERNPGYFDAPRPYLDKLTVRVVPDEDQRIDTYVTGGIDGFFTFSRGSLDRAVEDGGGTAYEVKLPDAITLLINHAKPPFDDLRVRQALAYALDREAMNETTSPGVTTADNFTLEGTPWYSPDASLPEPDTAKAQALIDEYAAETGGPVKVHLVQNQGDIGRTKFVQTTLEQLDKVETTLEVVDSPTFIQRAFMGEYNVMGWGLPWLDPDVSVAAALSTTGSINFGKYSNPRVDELIAQSKATDDLDTRVKAYSEVFTIAAEEIATLPINHGSYGFVFSDDVHDVELYEDGIPRWDLLWRQA